MNPRIIQPNGLNLRAVDLFQGVHRHIVKEVRKDIVRVFLQTCLVGCNAGLWCLLLLRLWCLPPFVLLCRLTLLLFRLRFGFDGWQQVQEVAARSGVFGIWYVLFSTVDLQDHRELNFARYYEVGSDQTGHSDDQQGWEGIDYTVMLHTEEAQAVAKSVS